MASNITPQILCPDGVLRTNYIFSTTRESRFFTGTVDVSTVDIEVSIAGGAYTRSSDFVVLSNTGWVVPNPEVYPDGLDLDAGENTILIRAITSIGTVSNPASITATLIQDSDLSVVAYPPTNINLEQLDNYIRITVDGPTDTTNFRGINVYASLYDGGGVTGYTRVNLEVIAIGTTVEEVASLGSIEVQSNIATTGGGSPAADPLYVHYLGKQTDKDGVVVQSDFDERLLVPETTQIIRSTVYLDSVRTITQYSFDHSRSATQTSETPTVFIGSFSAAPNTDPLFYVTTGVYYDPVTLVEVESSFSAEVVGRPLAVTTVGGSFPVVGRNQILRDAATSIQRSNPQIRIDPGSVVRDTFLDPFSSEAERLRFIVDFLHRAQSFSGLLAVDDPANTGLSSSVGTNAYKVALKRAFSLTKDSDVQAIIDRAFESLASNFGIFRRNGRFSRGEVTFYTTKRPTSTYLIPLGTIVAGGSNQFKVLTSASIPFANLARYYDPISGRYQVTVSVQATTVGTTGNVAAGQIRKVVAGVSGLSVLNAGAMFGGTNQETNQQLATRAQNALASVDSGTAQGYLQTAADVPGVIQAEVVPAGSDIMIRDLDANGVHRGGKVDIWIQGENLAQVTDTFSFARTIAKDVHFVVIGSPSNYTFQAVDPDLTSGKPIAQMLDNETLGLGLRNATTGLYFDLTDVTIISYNTIRLSTSVYQPPVTLSDVVLGDYRRTTGNTFTMTRQPVQNVLTVVGSLSGTLPVGSYVVVHPNNPLETGRSAIAGDYLEITPVVTSTGLVPTGGSITVVDEPHVMLAEYPEYLDYLGVDPLTVVVTSSDGLVTYRGPDDPSGVSDYTIVDGDETTPYAILRVTSGLILSGETVLVSYEHDENFTVTYQTNVVVSVTQQAVNVKRHVTADVLVKDGVPVPVDISATVVLIKGSKQATVDQAIRTNLANLFQQYRLGDAIRQSDVVGVIERTPGVSYVEVPLTSMYRQEGSTVVQDMIATGQVGDSTYIATWSNTRISVWLLEDQLSAATSDGGGPVEAFRGVFQNDEAMSLLTSNPAVLGTASGKAYIIGRLGLSIPGYSDDTTLTMEGYASTAELEAQRRVLTANRVLVSTTVDDAPTNHTYTATYVVGLDSGVKNIQTNRAEYLKMGSVDFTFDEDR